jgi:hypothetical protein
MISISNSIPANCYISVKATCYTHCLFLLYTGNKLLQDVAIIKWLYLPIAHPNQN